MFYFIILPFKKLQAKSLFFFFIADARPNARSLLNAFFHFLIIGPKIEIWIFAAEVSVSLLNDPFTLVLWSLLHR